MPISIYLPNIRHKDSLPQEDSSFSAPRVWAIADGVTRDPKLPENFNSKSIEDILAYYPRPSGAKVVANIFTKNFITLVKKNLSIKDIFQKINVLINIYNKKNIAKVDYLVNDFFACVACGAYIKNNILKYGFIGDSGMAIFNSKGKLNFCTKDGMQPFVDYENKFLKKSNFNWLMPEYRVLVRSEFRNYIKKPKEKKIVYGALTGEVEAMKFVTIGEKKVRQGSKIVFFSDGARQLVLSSDFSEFMKESLSQKLKTEIMNLSLQKAEKDYENFGRERSMIIDNI